MLSPRLTSSLSLVAVLFLSSASTWAARGDTAGLFSASSVRHHARSPDSALPGKTRLVRVNQGMLRSGRLLLNLGLGPNVELDRTRSAEHARGAKAWIGKVTGDPDSEVILASKGNAVSGTIRHQGRLFKLEPIGLSNFGGDHLVIESVSISWPRSVNRNLREIKLGKPSNLKGSVLDLIPGRR